MTELPRIVSYLFHHNSLSTHSGMAPLVQAMGAEALYYHVQWERLQEKSWRLGHWLRIVGQRWSGSEWFAPLPVIDELRLVRALPRGCPSVAHYVFADFTPPRYIDAIHRRGGKVAATFHVSARRAPRVLGGVRRLKDLDAVTLMSQSQRSWFLKQGVAPERLHVIHHGVCSGYFQPAERKQRSEVLKMLLVGKTERDHVLTAEVMKRMPEGIVELSVMTAVDHHYHYKGVPSVNVLPRMNDEQLLDAYQQADLLFMPLLDCTANNAVLESMACGTPVMTNRVGGIPEYVDASCNEIVDSSDADEWVDRLKELADHREKLESWRPRVRAWAEKFDWTAVAGHYQKLFQQLVNDR